jgi:hypothetical protein
MIAQNRGKHYYFKFKQEMVMTKPTIIEIFKSVFSAFIGVQSEANRKKDFTEGSLKTYIIAGIVFTVIFIGVIIFVVSAVLG